MITTHKHDHFAYLLIAATIIIPVLTGIIINLYFVDIFVSIPLHSAIETFGAAIALLSAFIIFTTYSKNQYFHSLYMVGISFLSVGIFDFAHSMIEPSNNFIWLHSLSLAFGGFFFFVTWFTNNFQNKKLLQSLPYIIFTFSFMVVVLSLIYAEDIPLMQNRDDTFSLFANTINVVGGFLYIGASLYFLKSYFENGLNTNLIFAGLSMLFGTSGILFYFSSIWDYQWWFWHIVKLLAYILTIWHIHKIFLQVIYDREKENKSLGLTNKRLSFSNSLLTGYKNALFTENMISIADLKGNIKFINKSLLELSGYEQDEIIGKPHSIFRDPSTPKSIFQEMWNTIQDKKTFKGLIKNKKKSGESFYTQVTIIPILDKDQKIFEYLAIREDVTELVNTQIELKSNFFTDTLTKVFNHYKLLEDLKHMNRPHIAMINIDNFKSINDFYGQNFGDKVIVKLSNLLLDEVFIYKYTLYRNKGDKFVFISDKDETFSHFKHNVESIVRSLEHKKISIENEEIELTFTSGLAANTNDFVQCELALKEAKQNKQKTIVYSENIEIQQKYEHNIMWSNKIKKAINDDKIEIVFQPIFSNKTNTIEQYETLMRLIDEDDTIIEPSQFLNVAKQTKLYNELTKIVFTKAMMFLSQTSHKISIDINASDILDESTRVLIFDFISTNPYANRIILEIEEAEAIESYNEIKEFLTGVKKYGTHIAIDDFGVGYSNFEYLLKLQADYIKLDGSLIETICDDPNSQKVAKTIIDFAHLNNIQVIAESVSSKEILESVEALGVDFSQGYYLAKPNFWSELH